MTENQEKELDYLCSQATIARDPVCRVCGKAPSSDSHHIIYRSQSVALMYDLLNRLGLCRPCHTWAHENKERFETAAEILIGTTAFKKLKKDAHLTKPWLGYEEIKKTLTEAIRQPEKHDLFRR